MHVLLTGGAGFIGAATAAHLVGQGHRVRVLDDLSRGRRDRVPRDAQLVVADVGDAMAVGKAVAGVDAVVHLAARTSVPESFADPAGYASTNVVGTDVLLRASLAAGVRHVVLASSAAVYGTPQGPVQSEADVPRPESPYALTKLANESQAEAGSRRGLVTCCLRLFNVYGPGQDPAGPYASVVPRFVDQALHGSPLSIHGDGSQVRDFIHVHDVARAVEAALGREEGHVVCNIGTGVPTSVLQVAEAVEALHEGASHVFTEPRVGDVPSSLAETALASTALGFSPSIPFEQGLAATYAAARDLRDRSARASR